MEVLSTIITLTLAATIIIDSGLFLFIFLKKQSGALHTLLLLHLAGILGWAISTLYVLKFDSMFAAQCAFATALVLSAAKFFFIFIFPDNTLPRFSYHYLLLIPASISLVLSFVPNAIFSAATVMHGYYVVIEDGPYAPIYALTVAYFLIYPIIILIRKLRKDTYSHVVHEQIKYLLYGTSIFFIIGLTTNSILPVFFDIYVFNGLGPSFSLILAGLIVYIISKYDFLGLKVIIQRGAIYTTLLVAIIGVYLLIVNIAMILFGTAVHSNTTTFIGALITTILGIFAVPPTDQYLRRVTDSFFFKDKYNYSEALQQLSESLHRSPQLQDMTALIVSELKNIFKVDTVTIRLSHNPSKHTHVYTQENETTLLVPIVYLDTHIGLITLGSKRSGDTYTDEDKHLMQTFAYHIAVALERVRLFNEVAMYSKDLEQKVKQRTEQLEEAQRAQQHMMMDISHSLQTPLTIIKSEIAYLRKNTHHQEKVDMFERTIDDISQFIYNLLRLAHIEATADEVSEPIDLSTLIDELVEYFATTAAHNNITVQHTIEKELHIHGAKKRIEELVLTLLSNAEKYTKNAAQKDITVTLAKESGRIILTITDTGVGIHKDDIPHIFNRFYRSGHVKKMQIQGSGLGLTIAKSIAEKHNATISVKSTEGNGASFMVTFQPHQK